MRVFLSTLGLAVLLALLGTSARLSAVTVDQIVSLSKAGVSEAVILALLDRDRTVLTIDPEQLVTLKREGLSDTLIMAMLRNGRQEGDEAARAVSAERAADVLAALASTPQVTIVGHDPERPNTAHTEDLYAGIRDGVRLPAAIPYGSPYAIPYPSAYGCRSLRPHVQGSAAGASQSRALPGAGQHGERSGAVICHGLSRGDAAGASRALIAAEAIALRSEASRSAKSLRAPADFSYDCRSVSKEICNEDSYRGMRRGARVGPSAPATCPRRCRRNPGKPLPQKIDEEYTQAHQGVPAGSADHDRARRSPAGVRHRAVAAQVPRPHRRHAGRADLRQGHPSLLRGAREGLAAREVLEDRHDRRRPRHRRARDRRRGDDQVARQVPRHARRADRSAQDHRRAGAAAAARRRSRSTTSSAACTRRRPAGPRC